MAAPSLPCANCRPDGINCQNPGKSACANCRLVVYCSSECQKVHWPIHKIDCKSSLNKKSWEPEWIVQNRAPTFRNDDPITHFGGVKYLWGNVTTLDVLKLDANEGEEYGGSLSLLFAASGDMRNVVKTIAQLPQGWDKPIAITINDREFDIVARNAIMLLVALAVDDKDEAIDCIIHIWYSSFIRKSDLNILEQQVRPLIQAVCDKIKNKPTSRVLRKSWTFGTRSFQLTLSKSRWYQMLSFLAVPTDLTLKQAGKIRKAVTLAKSQIDYRHRHYLFIPPAHRVAQQRFKEDGILQSFGAGRSKFTVPSPTFFHCTGNWPMPDGACPLDGWSLNEVEMASNGMATSDIFGKLFSYFCSVLKSFLTRISNLEFTFRLFQQDAVDLPKHLENASFDRIEVSNASDAAYLGIPRTIILMAPLLRPPTENPRATLITLFMNAITEHKIIEDDFADLRTPSPTMERLFKYLPVTRLPLSDHDSLTTKQTFGIDLVRNYDYIVDRFANRLQFNRYPECMQAELKDQNTIIERWLTKPKLQLGQDGAQEEFYRLLASATGKEFYLEWKRV
ncbi:hypothetical protein FBEOM_6783 [Fusarium beomiforme]|uniref:MYND-type domain-containing protein n=1 Tax=Fusarium beomiforme TaxID=44412 RepID=A0A9P5AIS1_9HYPO|nr:hypothetical protein FBEOM_6783 [Fusarium beomiforme]